MFLILIAVVLFAALSFAITMSSRSGGNVNEDNVRIAASQIIQSGIDIDTAVLRLRVSQAVADTDISFENPMLDDYDNPGCILDRCKVFTPTGGQISYNKPNPGWLEMRFDAEPFYGEWLYTGSACVPGMGKGHDAGCATEGDQLELLAILPYLTRAVCSELNRKLGISQIDGNPPQLTGSGWASGSAKFTGVYGSGQAIIDSGNALFGQAEGCFEGNATPPSGSYHYYRAILVR